MSDAERLRAAMFPPMDAPWDTNKVISEVCAAIVEEFGLVRDEYGVDMNREGLERFVYAILDVAEGK